MEEYDVRRDAEALIKKARELGAADARLIRASDVVVRSWVRLKCRYGCDGYGRRFTCPPYSPTPDETRRVLQDYSWGILFMFRGFPKISLHKFAFEMERAAFLMGYHAAFSFASGPCDLCPECNLREGYCRHPDMARPAMEACGIDVFSTARAAGFPIKVLTSEEETPTLFTLLMLA